MLRLPELQLFFIKTFVKVEFKNMISVKFEEIYKIGFLI